MGRYDAIVLLGTELDAADRATGELLGRVEAAARAYAQGCADVIVACGGVLPGHTVSEADVMARLLEEEGVPPGAIVRETQSQDTMENMRFAARLLGGARGRRVLVVTSDYHLQRALMTARRVGFRAGGMPAPMAHDALWKAKKKQEPAFVLDLLMGWQDEGKERPDWAYRLFAMLFGKRR